MRLVRLVILLSPFFVCPLMIAVTTSAAQADPLCCTSAPCDGCPSCDQGSSPGMVVQPIPNTGLDIDSLATDDSVSTSLPPLAFNTQSAAFAGDTYAAADSKAGYIDTALIRSMMRLRFDAAYAMNRPDRAEFFYTTWQSLGGNNPNPPTGFPEPDIDRQSIALYLEHAFNRNISVFVDVPFVFSDPLRNPNDQAFGDMQAGVKLSLLHDQCQQLTFQLKNYIPLHNSSEDWVGTGHYSIEPGILYYRQLNRRWSLEAEVRDWIPIGGAENAGQDYAGNVLRYGLGLGTDIGTIGRYRIKPIIEFVGWSVLEGQVFSFNDSLVDFTNANLAAGDIGPVDADGDTIVNLKLGARIANCCGNSIYAGWGRSLTGDRWYRDIFRIELRRFF